MNKINSSFITCGVLSLLGVALSTFTAISLPVAVFVERADVARVDEVRLEADVTRERDEEHRIGHAIAASLVERAAHRE